MATRTLVSANTAVSTGECCLKAWFGKLNFYLSSKLPYLLKNMGFLTIFQCGCCDMDDLCLGSARHRRGPIAMKTLPLSRPGDTLECKTEERCPGTPALIGASLCTRVAVHGETPGLALLSCFALTHRAPGSHTHTHTPHTTHQLLTHHAPGSSSTRADWPRKLSRRPGRGSSSL